jgi:hypothetical protein
LLRKYKLLDGTEKNLLTNAADKMGGFEYGRPPNLKVKVERKNAVFSGF